MLNNIGIPGLLLLLPFVVLFVSLVRYLWRW